MKASWLDSSKHTVVLHHILKPVHTAQPEVPVSQSCGNRVVLTRLNVEGARISSTMARQKATPSNEFCMPVRTVEWEEYKVEEYNKHFPFEIQWRRKKMENCISA